MSSAVLLFLARMLLLLLLYAFLYVVVRALRRDLHTAVQPPPPAVPQPAGGGSPPASAVVPAARGFALEVVDGGQTPLVPGARFPVRTPFLIGRSATNDVALEDDWVSAQHLRLRQQGGTWLAEDLGSTNGTRVNGHPLKSATRVRAGDVLDLGRVKLRLVEQP